MRGQDERDPTGQRLMVPKTKYKVARGLRSYELGFGCWEAVRATTLEPVYFQSRFVMPLDQLHPRNRRMQST